jgi:hypothetical protein
MPTPQGSALIKDLNGIPIPQTWDPVNQVYVPLGGDNATEHLFAEPRPFTSGQIVNSATVGNAYRVGFSFQTSPGKFYGATGQYKGSSAIWIMAFDSASAPSANAIPLIATAVPAASGADQNWILSPGAAYVLSNGLYIGISTTGGLFTASTNADFTGIATVST